MKKPAHRGATAGLRNAFLAARTETYAPAPASLQARTLSHRYGLTPAVAAAVAEHLFAVPEHWSCRT
jgi:hypothetical protein